MPCVLRTLVIIAITETNGDNSYDEALETFLYSTMENYGEWLNANTFDPAPIYLASSGRNANFTFETRNLKMTGSNYLDHGRTIVSANLVHGNMTVIYDILGESKISGVYVLDGNIFSSVPVSGQGTFTLEIGLGSTNGIFGYAHHLDALFDVTEQGFIKLDKETATNKMFYTSQNSLTVEKISAGGYEALVKEIILEEFMSYFGSPSTKHIFETMLVQYLNEVFGKTPLVEIIGQSLYNTFIQQRNVGQ